MSLFPVHFFTAPNNFTFSKRIRKKIERVANCCSVSCINNRTEIYSVPESQVGQTFKLSGHGCVIDKWRIMILIVRREFL